MVSVIDLWLPILLSAIGVFLVSFLLHMVLKYHNSDVRKLDAEDTILAAVRGANPAPGDYAMPHATMETMNSPEFIAKRSAGVVVFMTVLPGGPPKMTKELVAWFIYSLVVGVFVAYVSGRALGAGPVEYLDAFRFAGTTAFMGYGLAQVIESVWWARAWSTTFKNLFDALVYALVTAGIFGWLWPGA
jgi:hypothetical protein